MIAGDVIGAVLILLTAFLAEKASEKWKKLLWGLFILLVLAQTGLQIRAHINESKEAEARQKEISELNKRIGELGGGISQLEINTQRPPNVNVNIPPQPQQAYVHSTTAAMASFDVGTRLSVNDVCANSGPALATQVECLPAIYVVKTEPIGIGNQPMVRTSLEDKTFAIFLKDVAKLHGNYRTLVAGESQFATAIGPELDPELDGQIKKGDKTILAVGEYKWKDSSGRHLSEKCAWLQPGWVLAQQTWHYCEHHNGQRF